MTTMRLGFSHVAGTYPIRTDFLQYGASQGAAVNASKMKAVKLFLTSNYVTDYPGQTWGTTYTTLAGLATNSAYTTIFNTPQFERVYLAAYTFINGVNNPWSASVSETMLSAEYTELRNLAEYLLSTYSNKTFVLSSVESDWGLMRGVDPTVSVNPETFADAAAFFRRRQKAVEDARANVSSSSTVLHAVEVNRVLDRNTYRMHRDVLPIVQPDMVCVSLYEAINDWLLLPQPNQATLLADIDQETTRVVLDIKAYNPKARISITDWGWPETNTTYVAGSYTSSALIAQVLMTATNLGVVEDVLYWNVFDNAPSYGQQALYTKTSGGTTLTTAGTYFASL